MAPHKLNPGNGRLAGESFVLVLASAMHGPARKTPIMSEILNVSLLACAWATRLTDAQLVPDVRPVKYNPSELAELAR